MKTSKAEPRFDLDLRYGQEGERRVKAVFDGIADGSLKIEVKTKTYLDLWLYVETHCDKGRRGIYQPSGINDTTANLWVFAIDETNIHIAIPTDLVRRMLDDASSKDRHTLRGNCPTRGRLIHFGALLFRLQRERGRDDALTVIKSDVTVSESQPFEWPTVDQIFRGGL